MCRETEIEHREGDAKIDAHNKPILPIDNNRWSHDAIVSDGSTSKEIN